MNHRSLFSKILLATALGILSACSCCYEVVAPCDIACMSFIDRDGFSTTVHSTERLQQYSRVDFLAPQAYQKVMCIYKRDPCGDIAAFITSYYPNGQAKQYLDLINSRAYGSYQEWHDNGTLKLDCQVIGGEPDITPEAARSWIFNGECRAFDMRGNLDAIFNYEMGSLEGDALQFYPDGTLKKRTPYCRNLPQGLEESFTECGELQESISYEKGVRQGPSMRYWSGGEPAAEENYSNGNLVSGRYVDSKGEAVTQVENGFGFRAVFLPEGGHELYEYRNGVPEGEVKIFGAARQLKSLYHLKDGKRHGEEAIYYPTTPQSGLALKPKLSLSWYEDKIHGIVKTWYDTGAMESQREISHNSRNGLATAWYRNGSVMLMEEYDHDKLVKGEYFKRGESRPESRVADGSGVAILYDPDANLIRKVHYFHGHPLD